MRTKEEKRKKLVGYFMQMYEYGINEVWNAERESNKFVDKYFRWCGK